MKFNKTLNASIINEWRFYSVDYKAMKGVLKDLEPEVAEKKDSVYSEFFSLYETSQGKITKFYTDKEAWAVTYFKTLEDRMEALRACKVSAVEEPDAADSSSEVSSTSEDSDDEDEPSEKPKATMPRSQSNAELKEEYRKVGKSKHFQSYIYAKKSLVTFARELELVLEFLHLNKSGFDKILKKYDKRTGSSLRETKMLELEESHGFLNGDKFKAMAKSVDEMLEEVETLKPCLPEGWEERKVYTIGCFDLFHRGHQNVLKSLREFGYFIVAGIHDDESYFKLKNKYTIDNLETRMKNVKPFVDQIYVIPSTDPALYLKSMVSEQDIESGSCCYARGDDMLNFPGREWVESVMPVHFVPRTESCSSTLIRTIYHAECPEIRKKAAFANTRYDGKPIDEDGNVLKFQ